MDKLKEMYSATWLVIKNELGLDVEDVETLQLVLSQLVQKIGILKQELQKADNEHTFIFSSLNKETDSLKTASSSLDEKDKELTLLKEQERRREREKEKLVRETEQLAKEIERVVKERECAERERECAVEERELVAKEKELVAKERECAMKEIERLRKEKEQARREREEEHSKLSESNVHLENEVNRLRRENEEVNQRNSTIERFLSTTRVNEQRLERECESLKEIIVLNEESAKELVTIEHKNDELKKLSEEKIVLEESLKRLEAQSQELAKVVAEKEERLEAQSQELAKVVAEKEERLEVQRQELAKVVAEKEERLEVQRQELAKVVAEKEEMLMAQSQELAKVVAEKEERLEAQRQELTKTNQQIQNEKEKIDKEKAELIQKLSIEKAELAQMLSEEKNVLEKKLIDEKNVLEKTLTKEKNDLIQKLSEEKNVLEKNLTKEKNDLIQKLSEENKFIKILQDTLIENSKNSSEIQKELMLSTVASLKERAKESSACSKPNLQLEGLRSLFLETANEFKSIRNEYPQLLKERSELLTFYNGLEEEVKDLRLTGETLNVFLDHLVKLKDSLKSGVLATRNEKETLERIEKLALKELSALETNNKELFTINERLTRKLNNYNASFAELNKLSGRIATSIERLDVTKIEERVKEIVESVNTIRERADDVKERAEAVKELEKTEDSVLLSVLRENNESLAKENQRLKSRGGEEEKISGDVLCSEIKKGVLLGSSMCTLSAQLKKAIEICEQLLSAKQSQAIETNSLKSHYLQLKKHLEGLLDRKTRFQTEYTELCRTLEVSSGDSALLKKKELYGEVRLLHESLDSCKKEIKLLRRALSENVGLEPKKTTKEARPQYTKRLSTVDQSPAQRVSSAANTNEVEKALNLLHSERNEKRKRDDAIGASVTNSKDAAQQHTQQHTEEHTEEQINYTVDPENLTHSLFTVLSGLLETIRTLSGFIQSATQKTRDVKLRTERLVSRNKTGRTKGAPDSVVLNNFIENVLTKRFAETKKELILSVSYLARTLRHRLELLPKVRGTLTGVSGELKDCLWEKEMQLAGLALALANLNKQLIKKMEEGESRKIHVGQLLNSFMKSPDKRELIYPIILSLLNTNS